ncbi:hypothetical protein PAMP_005153 [Pampus punctatissimus]
MRIEQHPTLKQAELDVRSCCLTEIKQTEEKYTETLESIEKYFLNPLKKFFSPVEIDKVFVNIPDLVKVHKSLMVDVQDSILNRNALNLYEIFIIYKDRLLIYGIYCSRVEIAIAVLDLICKEKEDVRLKLEECSKRANNGKFTLRDLLVVPMQRVLKYHLLLQELVKHTHDAAEKSNLKIALDAMKDLAQYVNEVKRDNETLREIDQYQRSIENLNQPLMSFGRPKGDGEVRMVSSIDKKKQDRRGDNYEMKDVLDLNFFKITNNPTSDRECKKWCYGFYVTHNQGHTGFELFFKTRELKKKWLDRFEMAISNIRPEKANHNSHQFKMHTFERITSCSFCHLLLRGIFNQGYFCLKCGLGAHKECLGRLGVCGRTDFAKSRPKVRPTLFFFFDLDTLGPILTLQVQQQEQNGKYSTTRPSSVTKQKHKEDEKGDGLVRGLPRMVVIRDYSGIPCPQHGPPLSIHAGDVIELMFADLHSSWWQVPKPVDYSAQLCVNAVVVHGWFRFAGPMDRDQADVELLGRENSTFLVRHRSKECTEYAISIKFNGKVKHIKIRAKDGCFYIAESRLFKSVLDLVEYYKQHSLKEGFSSLDTTLQIPYRELSNGNMPGASGSALVSQRIRLQSSSARVVFVHHCHSPRYLEKALTDLLLQCILGVLGIAVARYDFSSTETQELSLLQGDLIKIYTKMSNGWWQGEVDGRVGWFPSTFVEEED